MPRGYTFKTPTAPELKVISLYQVERNMPDAALAKRLKWSVQKLQRHKRGDTDLKLSELRMLAKVLNIPADEVGKMIVGEKK